MTFTLRLSNSENPQLRSEAPVVSSHSSLRAARRAFFGDDWRRAPRLPLRGIYLG